MREASLREFFEGGNNVTLLRKELADAIESRGPNWTSQIIIPMDTDFKVGPQHLIQICDAVLGGVLSPALLEAVGFCLVASDHFCWDGDTPGGELVANTAYDWAAPEINHSLTHENIEKFKERLVTGRDTF
jgi:hypothetical protein